MAEIVGSVLWGEGSESFAESLLEGDYGASFESAELLLHLGPTLLDGVEVGRVGRQVAERSSGLLDKLSDAVHLVSSQVVHDDQLPRFQLWAKDLFQISQEDISIGGRLNGHNGHPAGNAHCSQYSQCAPVTGGNSLIDARAM